MRAYASNTVSEFSDDIVELNGVGYWLKTGLGLRGDIAPLSAIAPPRVERVRHRNGVNRFSETLPRRLLFTVPPLEPKTHRIIVS